ncbi:MAG TPA: hypothetical protein VKV30_13995 [Candidatus Angelobacter sp.]|nr:hypothetical protein [Candidatus Angelobacter sp.]
MNDKTTDGKLQVTAAISLLKNSKLVRWKKKSAEFVSIDKGRFEKSWQRIDPVFGRLICWINFSAGAEFLAKGVCLLRGIELLSGKGKKTKMVPEIPSGDFSTWAEHYPLSAPGQVKLTDFGTLGDLQNGPLKELCNAAKASEQDQQWVLAAYDLLGKSIRNRDAHAYVPNVRDSHFHLVDGIFTPCLNLLMSWIPYDKSVINDWMDQAPNFID